MSKNRGIWLAVLLVVALGALVIVLPTGNSPAVAEEHEPTTMYKGNHYKCYPVRDWGEWEPQAVGLKDQFGASEAKVVVPRLLCNPVDKNKEGIANEDNHLVCYQINDDPSGPAEPIEEVWVENQFGGTQLWVGVPGNMLCLPSSKKHIQD